MHNIYLLLPLLIIIIIWTLTLVILELLWIEEYEDCYYRNNKLYSTRYWARIWYGNQYVYEIYIS